MISRRAGRFRPVCSHLPSRFAVRASSPTRFSSPCLSLCLMHTVAHVKTTPRLYPSLVPAYAPSSFCRRPRQGSGGGGQVEELHRKGKEDTFDLLQLVVIKRVMRTMKCNPRFMIRHIRLMMWHPRQIMRYSGLYLSSPLFCTNARPDALVARRAPRGQTSWARQYRSNGFGLTEEIPTAAHGNF